MRTLTGTTAATQKDLTTYAPVWLVKISADRFVGTAANILYYASEAITINSVPYVDGLTEKGLSFGWWTLRPEGGLATQPEVTVTIRNEAVAHSLLDEYYVANDEVEISVVFATGAEAAGDIIPMWRGVIDRTQITEKTWTITARNNATANWSEIPTRRVTLEEFPYAPLPNYGEVLPVNLGKFAYGARPDTVGAPPFVAPTIATGFDSWHAGDRNKSSSITQVLEYWPQAGRWADVAAFGTSGADSCNITLSTATPAQRVMFLYPVSPGPDNNVNAWATVADRNKPTPVLALANTNVVQLYFEGCPTLGDLTALELAIDVDGSPNFDWSIELSGSAKHAATGATADVAQALDIADHANNWKFQAYRVKVTANASFNLREITLKSTFDAHGGTADQPGRMFLFYEGRRDNASFYNPDGATNPLITSSNATLEAPLHLLEYTLRATDLLNLDADRLNLTAFDDASDLRSAWKFATTLTQPIDPTAWINEYCYQAGIDLYENAERQWTPLIRNTDAAPVEFFTASDLAVQSDATGNVSEWTSGIRVSRLSGADVVTDIHLKYNQNRMSGEYQSDIIQSGRALKTGTCSIVGSTKKLTDSAAAFNSDVSVGWVCYFDGADAVNVIAAIDSDTVIELTDTPGDQAAGTRYWIGPGLNKTMFLAAKRYKSDQTLGQQETSLVRRGGYGSTVIGTDTTTAQAIVDHWSDWLSQAWQVVEFTTYLNAVALELGDVILVVNPWVTEFQPAAVALIADATDAATTMTITLGAEDNFSVGDWAYINAEVVKITAIAASTLTITRAQAGTTAAAHSTGDTVNRISRTYRITGLRPEPPHRIAIRAQQTPYNKDPQGTVIYVTQTIGTNTSYATSLEVATNVEVTVGSGVTVTIT